MNTKAKNNTVINYWYKFFATQHCTLCGNSGVIDTTGTCTAGGVHVGRKNFCICPNGQQKRASSESGRPE